MDDVPLPANMPEDEKPFIAECQQLFRTLKPGLLNALYRFCRYKDAAITYKSIRNYFDRLVELGLANRDRTPTAKARCLYRIMVCDLMEDVNDQVQQNHMRNEVMDFFNSQGLDIKLDNGEVIDTSNHRVLITPRTNWKRLGTNTLGNSNE